MGYFSNGAESEMYEAVFCSRCVHQKIDDGGCMVWLAHMEHNYEECNNDESILHLLIPRDGIENKQCTMFHPKEFPNGP